MVPERRQRRILHVLPADLGRGAQVYADALVRALDGAPDHHAVLTIFRAPQVALPGRGLGLRPGRARAAGLDLRVPPLLRRALRRGRPDVVVAHGGEALKYVALARPRAPLAYYKIGTLTAAARHGSRHRWQRWLLRSADLVAAVSNDAAAEAVDVLGVDPDRVRVIPNGRDPHPYATLEVSPVPSERPTLGFLGALTAGKRPLEFLRLVRRLRADGIAFDACLAGDGPDRDAVEAAAEGLDVDVLGLVTDVPALLGGWDVLAFTSRPEGEGMPGVLIEAGLAGVAVVATAVPGVRDVIESGTTGVVVPVDDADALHAAVAALLVDGRRRRAVGDAARARCEERFTLSASAAQWQDALDDLAGPVRP